MIKNQLNSVLLSILLLVPGQVWCSEQPVPQGILDRLMISMPAAPAWMSNFSTNVASSFSTLSDNGKYLIYGTAAALFAYVVYKTKNMFNQVPTSMEGRDFWKPNTVRLDSHENYKNIAYIIRVYPFIGSDKNKELAFRHYVCPVLQARQDDLDSKEKWKGFLSNLKAKSQQGIRGITLLQSAGDYGLNILNLINNTCPNDKITTPLAELLIEYNPDIVKNLDMIIKK